MDESTTVEQPFAGVPAQWVNADAAAIQALEKGRASKEQQKRAYNFILYRICEVDEFEYRTNDREHAFCSGKRSCGIQIKKLTSVDLSNKIFEEDHGE